MYQTFTINSLVKGNYLAYNRSAYDCAYLALAREEGCTIYTANRRLFNALKSKIKSIKWIGNYKAQA